MDGYCKEGYERLREIVSLHHNAITTMLGLIRAKSEAETEFWTSLKNHLEKEIGNGKQPV